ncbi:MAG: hypothetical protein OXC62_08155 [Aestuariivita sp.]|nr:hypothetical protein [Aestuariivita sp.]
MDRKDDGVAYHIATPSAGPEKGQKRCASDRQPMGRAFDAGSGLIPMGDQCLCNRTPHRVGKFLISISPSGHQRGSERFPPAVLLESAGKC